MAEVFRTRCTEGTLLITDQAIIIELGKGGNIRQQTLMRSAFTGVESKMGVPSIFGKGGGTNLIFHGQGTERLHAGLVNPGIAKEIVAFLQGR